MSSIRIRSRVVKIVTSAGLLYPWQRLKPYSDHDASLLAFFDL
jgi:hypothetical protein